jgi:hypothetical protein
MTKRSSLPSGTSVFGTRCETFPAVQTTRSQRGSSACRSETTTRTRATSSWTACE